MRPSSSLAWQQVHWPLPLDSTHALWLLQGLAAESERGPIVFEVRTREGRISHLIGAPRDQANSVSRTITDLISDALIVDPTDGRSPMETVARLSIAGSALPLRLDRAAPTNTALVAALARADRPGEELALQVVLGRGIAPRLTEVDHPDPTQPWFDALTRGARPSSREVRRRLEAKRSELGFELIVRVGAIAKSDARMHHLLGGVLTALRTLQAAGTRLDFVRERLAAFDAATLPYRGVLRLTCTETLCLLGWPLDSENLPGMPSPHPRRLRLSARSIETVRVFATSTAPGPKRPIGIGADDAVFHTVLTGPTGTGKSTVLLNLIVADMEAGRGVVVIDPKSDLVRDVLGRVPASRFDDIVVLDPTDSAPVGLNPLRVAGTSHELVADGILTVFRDLFPSMFGPRTSDVLHASLLTLADIPGATLTWLPRLLTDTAFRNRHLPTLDDPDGLDGFWSTYEALSVRQQAQFIGPVLSRLRQFLLRPSLRRVLDQAEPRFTIDQVFTDAKILLVPLNGGLIGSTATHLLGSLLVGQLWQRSLTQARVPIHQRRPVSIYIDETQEFLRLGSDLADALARSRALGVSWHLAHQFRDQFTKEAAAAIDANARNKIVFGVGSNDARDFARMALQLKADDFMALPKYHIYARLMRDGEQLPWVSGRTLPPPPVTSDPVALLAASQARYGRDLGSSLSTHGAPKHAGPSDAEEPIGRRRRTPQ